MIKGLICSFIFFAQVLGASAYVPPAGYVLQKMVATRKGSNSFIVRSKVKVGERNLQVITWVSVPKKTMKTQILTAEGVEVKFVEKPFSEASGTVAGLLFSQDAGGLLHAFAGGLVRKPALKRWEGKVAWDLSALWIEKDSFLPLKKIKQSEKDLECGFQQYHAVSSFYYPFHMQCGEITEDVTELLVNPKKDLEFSRLSSNLEPDEDAADAAKAYLAAFR